MKRKIMMLFVCLIIGQTAVLSKQKTNIDTAKLIPLESVYIHFNSATLFVGERLYYNLYCLNSATEKLSSLSKVAYIELVGENKKVIFKHKLKLNDGTGQGDFKIPTETPSGNYKIIGYTQWMRNDGEANLFYGNITIINPYRADQQVFLEENKDTLSNKLGLNQRQIVSRISPFLNIQLPQKNFKKRSEISLMLTSNDAQDIRSNYSVSVRKIDEIDVLQKEQITSMIFKKSKPTPNRKELNNIIFLPELRGEIISGVLLNKNDDKPISNEKVALSIQQKDFILKISTTNNDGRFYFNLNADYSEKNAIVQMLNDKDKTSKIMLDNHKSISTEGLSFGKFKISKKYNDYILERSIYNQIESGYMLAKQDSLKNIENTTPFFGHYDIVYKLDDFSRFPTVKETFIEIIKNASIISKDNDQYGFYVESLDPYIKNSDQVAVIVDGVLLQEYSKLMEYNARNIEKISIARTETKFVVGTKLYEGFIVIETFNGGFNNEYSSGYFTKVALFMPQPIKKYFKRRYDNNHIDLVNKIPDFRRQLLWEPKIEMNTQNLTLNFFTSDNIGTYEISIEGFTKNGDPISLKEYFIVE